jgi:LemA protein
VDVYLRRRADLIPNLVEAVKAYASHEKTVLEAVTEARAGAAILTNSPNERAAAEQRVGNSLVRVLAIAEDYPELKASTNFLDLQRELSETETKLASARQYYNACVRDYNVKIESFPSSLAATLGGFKHAEFFELTDPSEAEAPKVEAGS